MNDPTGRQVAFNAASRDQWGAFEGHRRRVTSLLTAGAEPGRSRLCVLGAGNGNDLDLPVLLAAHREVHLVDLDADALARGARAQGVADAPNLHRHGGLDLTAMLDAVASWTPRTPIGPGDLAALAGWPSQRVPLALPGGFDVVASTCLLSQLIGNAFHAVGEAHPQFLPLVQAIRAGHLRLMTSLAAPGGTPVLITDVTSSDTLPELPRLDESSLPALLPRLARERNYFHGVNPAVLPTLFRLDPDLSGRATDLETVAPWRWRLHDRVYLVMALTWRAGRTPG